MESKENIAIKVITENTVTGETSWKSPKACEEVKQLSNQSNQETLDQKCDTTSFVAFSLTDLQAWS